MAIFNSYVKLPEGNPSIMEPPLLLLTNDWDKQNGTMELWNYVKMKHGLDLFNSMIRAMFWTIRSKIWTVYFQCATNQPADCWCGGSHLPVGQNERANEKKCVYIYWYIYILFFLMDRFFASNTTSRRGQGSLLLNDLVPHPTAQIVFPLKMKRSVMFFCPIPPILKYIVF